MRLLRERLSYFRVKLIALYVHPKNSKNRRLHSRSQQIRPRKQILGKQNKAEFFCVRQVYFTNSCQQIWGCVNQRFIFFIIQTSDRMRYFTIFQDKLQSVSQYSGRSMVGFQPNRSKNFQNHPYGQPVLILSIVLTVSVGSTVCHEL